MSRKLPANPYRPGSKKFQIAELLIRGEVDRGKIMRAVDVGVNVVYNVSCDLKLRGIELAITRKSPIAHNSIGPATPITQDEDSPDEEETVSPQESAVINVDKETLREILRETVQEVYRMKYGDGAQETQLREVGLRFEDVEIEAETVNVKVPLSPAVFHRYSIFQARLAANGTQWHGSFSDFLDLATRATLELHGLYPVVLKDR
ncbi:hypothetical protein MUP77_15670 [Candidatus Bathyarchaeota archaeon]|nr:hypothetical protein [Candidatus Bathyarchaeota archaeon]